MFRQCPFHIPGGLSAASSSFYINMTQDHDVMSGLQILRECERIVLKEAFQEVFYRYEVKSASGLGIRNKVIKLRVRGSGLSV